ncbi:MAG TPA: sugar ABC transporter substrate-binding protein [Anaerolineae bacterium]|nr:sugar ABC transporter substrate-binding protein [Anaerolineae bacterium]HOR00044.1 sugar ABC transporter substrate-binding protein [Anaerolineae bacterium]HPL27428.1 sugar ABC transporter substrate-binding protein [Anaerolineae bacterium]
MHKRLSIILPVVLAAAMILAACAPQASPAPTTAPKPGQATSAPTTAPAKKLRVGYCIPDAANSFLSALTTRVKELFAADGIEVIVAGGDSDAAKQYNQIENFISMKVDALIVMAVDPVGVLSAVEEAKKAGIKVLGVPVDNQGPYDAYMHTDQFEIGELAAKMGCDFINATYPDAPDKSVQVAIASQESAPEMKKRTDGFRTIDACPKAKLATYVDLPANPAPAEGVRAAENILTAHPNVKVFLVIGDSAAMGFSQAVRAYAPKELDKYAIFSGDVNPENIPLLEGCQDPYRGAVAIGGGPEDLAQRTYELVKKMVLGEPFPAETLDPLVTITCKK